VPGLGQNFVHAGLINKGDESEPSADIKEEGITDTGADVDV